MFCDTFHLRDSGWRTCESCEKPIHCGCIVSVSAFVLVAAGGIKCLACTTAQGDDPSKSHTSLSSELQLPSSTVVYVTLDLVEYIMLQLSAESVVRLQGTTTHFWGTTIRNSIFQIALEIVEKTSKPSCVEVQQHFVSFHLCPDKYQASFHLSTETKFPTALDPSIHGLVCHEPSRLGPTSRLTLWR